jgi:hypothetical protein
VTTDFHRAVREACLWLPEAEEFVSHGAPNFRVRGKTFATFVVNHHGDGKVALWLNAAPGIQEMYVRADPKRFFVPPYVGPRGWVGVHLDRGLPWRRIGTLVRDAYLKVAPSKLTLNIRAAPAIRAPARKPTLSEIDPMHSARGKRLLSILRGICLKWPETRELRQFGYPAWAVGKRTFCLARAGEGHLAVWCWVGVERQGLLTIDPRYRIPAYMGHNGWIALDVSRRCDRAEAGELALESYRHFASKRTLRRLDEDLT